MFKCDWKRNQKKQKHFTSAPFENTKKKHMTIESLRCTTTRATTEKKEYKTGATEQNR